MAPIDGAELPPMHSQIEIEDLYTENRKAIDEFMRRGQAATGLNLRLANLKEPLVQVTLVDGEQLTHYLQPIVEWDEIIPGPSKLLGLKKTSIVKVHQGLVLTDGSVHVTFYNEGIRARVVHQESVQDKNRNTHPLIPDFKGSGTFKFDEAIELPQNKKVVFHPEEIIGRYPSGLRVNKQGLEIQQNLLKAILGLTQKLVTGESI